jgi:hypothetical protein
VCFRSKWLTCVVYRGAAHSTTRSKGKSVKYGRHLTMNFKTTEQQKNAKHIPAHVYLMEPNTFVVERVVWYAEADD